MLENVISIILVVFIGTTAAAQDQRPPRGKSCEAFGRPDITIQTYEILDGRYPSFESFNVSQGCKEEAKKMVAKWRSEDTANWEKLSNQACSAEIGWVEKEPGKCQAGGPPPICVVDHWVKNPRDAKKAFEDRKKEVLAEREAALIRMACKCTRSELESARSIATPSATSPYYDPFKSPCYNNNCPPGYECNGGYCAVKPQLRDTIDKAVDPTLELGKVTSDALQLPDKMLSKILPKIDTQMLTTIAPKIEMLMKSMTWKVISSPYLGLLELSPISLWQDGYKKSTQEVGWSVQNLQKLYAEYDDFRQNKPARSPQQIGAEIQAIKKKLNDHIAAMNEYYVGIFRERELGRNACYEVFEFQHQQVMQSFANLMSLPAPKPQN